MGHFTSLYLFGGVAFLALVIRRTSGVLSSDALRPLGLNAQRAVDTAYSWGNPCMGKVTLNVSDLVTLMLNSRTMVREADILRFEGTGPDLEIAHADVSRRAKKLTHMIIASFISRAFTKERYYASSIAWNYSRQLHGIDELSDITGIPLPEKWEPEWLT